MGDVHMFNRQLRLLDYFDYSQSHNFIPFINKSNWQPPLDTISVPIQQVISRNYRAINRLSPHFNFPDNLTPSHRLALSQLKRNSDIVIKPADKGSAIVILDRQQYLVEAYRQLENRKHYMPIPHSLQAETQSRLISIFQSLKQKGLINHKQMLYLIGPNPPRARQFYLLPKIHKSPSTWTVPHEIPPGHPIVSDCGSESYNAAQYIDHFLNPLSQLHDSYLRDTYDFIGKIKNHKFSADSFLFTIDSLYTNTDTTLGLQAVEEIFRQHPDRARPDEEILALLEINLTRNDFHFNSQFFVQVQGTAMGKKFAPAYANIYMAHWERTLFQKLAHRPTIYYRFLDDIFGVWSQGTVKFNEFLSMANQHHPAIKLKSTTPLDTVDFLDTTVFFRV